MLHHWHGISSASWSGVKQRLPPSSVTLLLHLLRFLRSWNGRCPRGTFNISWGLPVILMTTFAWIRWFLVFCCHSESRWNFSAAWVESDKNVEAWIHQRLPRDMQEVSYLFKTIQKCKSYRRKHNAAMSGHHSGKAGNNAQHCNKYIITTIREFFEKEW